jgi:hypothetical protein
MRDGRDDDGLSTHLSIGTRGSEDSFGNGEECVIFSVDTAYEVESWVLSSYNIDISGRSDVLVAVK